VLHFAGPAGGENSVLQGHGAGDGMALQLKVASLGLTRCSFPDVGKSLSISICSAHQQHSVGNL
jgi:hypothetical protein